MLTYKTFIEQDMICFPSPLIEKPGVPIRLLILFLKESGCVFFFFQNTDTQSVLSQFPFSSRRNVLKKYYNTYLDNN